MQLKEDQKGWPWDEKQASECSLWRSLGVADIVARDTDTQRYASRPLFFVGSLSGFLNSNYEFFPIKKKKKIGVYSLLT